MIVNIPLVHFGVVTCHVREKWPLGSADTRDIKFIRIHFRLTKQDNSQASTSNLAAEHSHSSTLNAVAKVAMHNCSATKQTTTQPLSARAVTLPWLAWSSSLARFIHICGAHPTTMKGYNSGWHGSFAASLNADIWPTRALWKLQLNVN